MFLASGRSYLLALALVAPLVLTGCKVVSIAGEQQAEAKAFDARAYADGIWSQKAIPHLSGSAKPLSEVLPAIAADLDAAGAKYGYRPASEGSPWGFIVAATGTVKALNTKSRAGTLTLATDAGDMTVQIGPVVKGNAIRDVLPFVSFKDFTNQIDFADAGKALTAAAMAGIAPAVAGLAEGRKVRLVGAFTLTKATDPLLVTPVSLEVQP